MIALSIPKQRPTTKAAHAAFLAMLPTIRRYARNAFNRHGADAREEAIQEVIANAWRAYSRLVEQDRAELAYPTVLAKYAIAQVREGRRVGSRLRILDIASSYCQKRKGITVERLDHFDTRADAWKEILVEDRHATPAEIATTRIDFAAWLRSLPVKVRRVAKALASGETTSNAAKRFDVSMARISQLRRELKESWEMFVGEGSLPEQRGLVAA